MIINTQPQEGKRTDSGQVEVVSIFPTIQGEGPYAGTPALFVRLAGCNLQCPACDTDYTSGRRLWTVEGLKVAILAHLRNMPTNLVVFTGGEPFRQVGLVSVIRALNDWKVACQVETNGTLYLPLEYLALVVCSPKTGNLNSKLAHRMLTHGDCFKYVLDAEHVDESDGLPTSVLGQVMAPARPPEGFPKERIYLQPADHQDDESNKRNLDAVVASCFKYGYRLCLQIHKIAGLP